MSNTKKMWQRPEMTVLVRSNPEEAVLSACKVPSEGGPNVNNSCPSAAGEPECYNRADT